MKTPPKSEKKISANQDTPPKSKKKPRLDIADVTSEIKAGSWKPSVLPGDHRAW